MAMIFSEELFSKDINLILIDASLNIDNKGGQNINGY